MKPTYIIIEKNFETDTSGSQCCYENIDFVDYDIVRDHNGRVRIYHDYDEAEQAKNLYCAHEGIVVMV